MMREAHSQCLEPRNAIGRVVAFLESIDQAALDGGDKIPALLVRDFFGADESLVLLAGEQLDRFEVASPGGWIDYPGAHEDRWIFLAGDRSLMKKLGLKLGAN